MEARAAGLLFSLCLGLRLYAELIAQSCAPSKPTECQYLFADGFVKWGRVPDPDKAVTLGPYMREYKDLVSRSEAPVRELVSPNHWRVVVTRGFDETWRPGTIVYLYFFDPHGVLRLKSSGDLTLELARIGGLFGTPSELLAVCMRSETGVSYVTRVWVLPGTGSPRQVLFEGGALESVIAGGEGKPGGIYIVYLVDEEGADEAVPKRVFWTWDEATQRFERRQGAAAPAPVPGSRPATPTRPVDGTR